MYLWLRMRAVSYTHLSDNGLVFLPRYINAFMSLKVEQYVDFGTHGMFICSITEARVISNAETMTYTYYQNNVKPKPQTCLLYTSMPTYAGYFLYLMAIYVFCRTIWLYHKEKKTIFIIFSATLLSVILAALCSLPYTMDLLSSVGGNGYMDSRSGQASAILSWNYLHSLFFPYVRFDQNTIHLNESTIYVGLAAIILLDVYKRQVSG